MSRAPTVRPERSASRHRRRARLRQRAASRAAVRGSRARHLPGRRIPIRPRPWCRRAQASISSRRPISAVCRPPACAQAWALSSSRRCARRRSAHRRPDGQALGAAAPHHQIRFGPAASTLARTRTTRPPTSAVFRRPARAQMQPRSSTRYRAGRPCAWALERGRPWAALPHPRRLHRRVTQPSPLARKRRPSRGPPGLRARRPRRHRAPTGARGRPARPEAGGAGREE